MWYIGHATMMTYWARYNDDLCVVNADAILVTLFVVNAHATMVT